jgi:hypothetical protein
MISDIIDTIHAKRVDRCLKSNTTYSHEYSKVIPGAEHVKILPNPRFMCEVFHIKRVKYNNFYYTLDMIYLIVTEPRNAKQYFNEWQREITT